MPNCLNARSAMYVYMQVCVRREGRTWLVCESWRLGGKLVGYSQLLEV